MTPEPLSPQALDDQAQTGARIALWGVLLVVGAVVAVARLLLPGSPLFGVVVGLGTVPVVAREASRAATRNHRVAFTAFAVSLAAGSLSLALYPYTASPEVGALRATIDLATYVSGVLGIVCFVRGTGRPDADAWLDAGAIGVGVSLLLFEFVAEPGGSAATGRDASFGLVVAAVDAAILTCVARFVVRPLPSRGLSAIGLVLAIATAVDAGYYTATAGLGMPRPVYEAMWFFAYFAWAAAVVHPALPRLATRDEAAPVRPELEMRSSTMAIGIHSLGFVVTLFVLWHHVRNGGASTDWVFGVVFLVQVALVASRSYRIINRFARDVARREEVEARLRESEERFRTLTDIAPVGIFVSDVEGRSVFQNSAWKTISGIDPAAALGDGYVDSIHPDDREWAMAEWMRCVAATVPMHIEHRLIRPDGGVRWVSSRADPLRDESGVVTGWVGTISDVTDLVRAREEAQEAADFVGDLIEQSPIGIHVYGPEGDTLSMNPAKQRIRALVLGEHHAATTAVQDVRLDPLMVRMGQADAIARVFAGEAVPDPDVVRVAIDPADGEGDGVEDGELLALRISWFPVHAPDGSLSAVISFTEDVTPAVRAQEQERRVEARLAEASQFQALSVLAGGIAHDFNNLLGAILGRASLARTTTMPGTAVDRDLEAIEVAAVRAASLARQILAYAGRGRYAVERSSLETLMRETLEALSGELDPRASVDVSIAPGLEPVDVDPTQVRQLILNLVANAADALERQPGHIAVRTGRYRLAADDRELLAATPLEPGTYVLLEVEDDGHGMDEKTLGRVFDPFFTTRAVGRGLGLAAALGIVTAHGAGIRIRSTPGQGTRIQVLFPAATGPGPDASAGPAETAAAVVGPGAGSGAVPVMAVDPVAPAARVAPAAPVAPTPAGTPSGSSSPGSLDVLATAEGLVARDGRGTILVVDDEATVRAVARRVLERAGYRVVEAPGGAEGIRAFDAEPGRWAGAVVDLTMPDVDGLAVVEHVRAARASLPVVVVSGWAAQEVADRMASVPGVAFVEKPYRPAELLAALEGALPGVGVERA